MYYYSIVMNTLMSLGWAAFLFGLAYLALKLGGLAQDWGKHLEYKRWIGRR
jgi:hypothetical protein